MVGRLAEGVIAQDLDDAAVGDAPTPALLDHSFELTSQRQKALDPSLDVAELGLGDGVRGLAGLFRLAAEAQQVANGLQWEPQLPGVPDEGKPAYVLGPVEPLVAFRARRARKEADLLVVSDRLHLAPSRLSVWLCSRNDAIGNVAVILAASGVWASGAAWPDLLVATAMAGLFLWSATRITLQALREHRERDDAIAEGI